MFRRSSQRKHNASGATEASRRWRIGVHPARKELQTAAGEQGGRTNECSPERLFEAVRAALTQNPAPLLEGRSRSLLPLDGAERFAQFCDDLEVPLGSGSTGQVTRLRPANTTNALCGSSR